VLLRSPHSLVTPVTRAGAIALPVPKLRKGSYLPFFL
jgi:transposase-like protein